MDLDEAVENRILSYEAAEYIWSHFQLPRDVNIETVNTDHHQMEVLPFPAVAMWHDNTPLTPPIATEIFTQSHTIEFQSIRSWRGEVVECGYLPQTNTLYIRQQRVQPKRQHQSPELRQYLQRQVEKQPARFSNESILEWGDRLMRHGLMDNPKHRWDYQKAILTSPIQLIKGLIRHG